LRLAAESTVSGLELAHCETGFARQLAAARTRRLDTLNVSSGLPMSPLETFNAGVLHERHVRLHPAVCRQRCLALALGDLLREGVARTLPALR
jgi:hypothetical protein